MFEIIAAIMAAAGTAMQFDATASAAKKAQQETMAAIRRQHDLSDQASRVAMDEGNRYDLENRQDQQKQIQQTLEHDFSAPALDAQTINAKAATTQGDVSGDYTSAKAASDARQMQKANLYANMFARANSANRLRQNEAIRMANTAANIDRLGNFSRGQHNVDQYAIQQAANSGAGGQFLGSLLQTIGTAGMAGGFGGGGVTSPASLDSFMKSYKSGIGADLSKNFFNNARIGLLR